jgi:hypothetical protein
MSLSDIAKQVERYTIDNSPSIMTGIGVVGTITTAYLAGKASFKAAHILSSQDPHESIVEKTKRVWPNYIPAAISGGITIAAVIGANRVGSRRAAAVAAAYTLSERAYSEYKEKVIEKIGERKEETVREEIAQARVASNPPHYNNILVSGGGDVLFCDSMSMRYFMSSVENVRKAQNDLNDTIIRYTYATLSDFYDNLGLSQTAFSDEVGWNSDNLLTLQFTTALTEDNKPCIVINYRTEPIRKYAKLQ